MADRDFTHRRGVRHVVRHRADVVLRMNLTNLPLEDPQGQLLRLVAPAAPADDQTSRRLEGARGSGFYFGKGVRPLLSSRSCLLLAAIDATDQVGDAHSTRLESKSLTPCHLHAHLSS